MKFCDDRLLINVERNVAFKEFGVGFLKALKKVPNFVRNYTVCNVLGLLTFYTFNKVRFIYKLLMILQKFLTHSFLRKKNNFSLKTHQI